MITPQLGLTINGTTITDALLSADVDNNNFFSADTFSATIGLYRLPPAFNAAFWSESQAQIGISVGTGSGLTQLILGNADSVDLDLSKGTIQVEGRDLSAPLHDNKTEEKYQNLTSSEIAAKVAAQFGLTANVAATTQPAGRYYEIDHARLTNDITYWTLLNYLAQEEGFDVYVTGNTLNFQPAAASDQTPYPIQYVPQTPQMIQSGNFIDLKLHRSQTLAKGAVVKVVSWNSKQRTAFTATARSTLKGAGSVTAGTAQLYTFKVPGLTQIQAQNFANARLKEITLHERVVDVDMPGELTLQPRQLVSLTGTGTSFDQTYFIDHINRHVELGGGFTESIRMKNHSPGKHGLGVSEEMLNAMRREAARIMANKGKTRIGLIDSYDAATYSVKVRLQPDNTITGWIPLGALAVGPGWGIMAGPLLETQVKVSFQEDGHEVPIADFLIFDNENRPAPAGMAGPPSGEFWIVHQSGACLKFTNDGLIHLSGTATINVGNEANALHSLVTDALVTLFNNHVHTNGNDGANTGAPTTTMSAAQLTTVLKAN